MPARIESDVITVSCGPHAALAAEWRTLAASVAPGLPSQDPSWHAHWWRHLGRDDNRRHDEPLLLTARTGDGRLVGVAPFVATTRPGRGPLALRSIECVGADRNLTELRGTIISPDLEGEVVTAWLRHLDARDDWDIVIWSGIRDLGQMHKVLAERSDVWWSYTRPLPVLTLPDTYAEFRAGLSRNTREALRKAGVAGRKLGRSFDLIVHEAPVDVAAVDRFLALHWERSTAKGAVAHPDYFGPPRERAFVRSLLADGELGARVFELRSAGRVVASRVAFRRGDELYLYYSGYALDHAPYSVMTLLFDLTVRWAIDEGIATINLSPGMDRSKSRWKPSIVDYHEAIQHSPRWRGRAASAAFRGILEFRQRSYGDEIRGRAPRVEGTRLEGATVEGTKLEGTKLEGTKLEGTST